MDTASRVTVDEELFLGRLEEQDVFRHALHAIQMPQEKDAPPTFAETHKVKIYCSLSALLKDQ